jgi:SH3 domain protein
MVFFARQNTDLLTVHEGTHSIGWEEIESMQGKSIVLLAAILLTAFAGTGNAQTMYVSEDCEITVRTGASTEHRIIAMLKPGAAVEVMSPGDEWSQVRTPGGKEGWMLSRYLTSQEPAAMTLERLQQKVQQLSKQQEDLLEKNAALEADNQRLETTLANTRASLERIGKEHETLKRESADFLQLKSQHEKISRELTEVRDKAAKFEEESQRLLRNQSIKWFLAGGGILSLGFIIGFASKRQRRRSSLL